MHSQTDDLQQLVDVIAASVAIVEQTKSGKFKVVAYNDLFLRMLGNEKSQSDSPNPSHQPCLLSSLSSESAHNVFAAYLPQVFRVLEPIEIEKSFELSDEQPWWRLFLNPMERPPNLPQRVMIIGIHMNDKQQLQSEINSANNRFSSVIDTAFDGIITMNVSQEILLFNHAAENIFGYKAEETIGKPITMLMPQKFRASHADYTKQFENSPMQSRDMLSRVMISAMRKDGSDFPIEITISKIKVNGNMEFTAIIRDVSHRIAYIEHLQKQINTDNLTGLKNRNYFDMQLQDMIQKFNRFGEPFCVLMFDLDKFKTINDTYGHLTGDKVIQEFSTTASQLLREVDLLARYGGEEFVAILPNTQLAGAMQTAERVCKRITKKMVLSQKHESITFTVSIGAAEFTKQDDIKTIVSNADEAMYRAKHKGRNRVSD